MVFGFAIVASAQTQDVVYLNNGSIIKGKIVEKSPTGIVKIQTMCGSVFAYNQQEIQSLATEKMTSIYGRKIVDLPKHIFGIRAGAMFSRAGLGGFLDAVRFGDGFNFWGCGFLGLVSVGFCSVFCWFLCFWMLWAVVFILGRWLVWWFGFCGVFWFLSSFASLYSFNFANFYVFLGGVNSSAVNVNGSNFYFFKGS
jgi:hypothetical protein